MELQRMKVQLLETQKEFLVQSIELAHLKLEKVNQMLRVEQFTLAGMEKASAKTVGQLKNDS